MKKDLSKLTKDEKSLLLFFECAAVDYGGKLNIAHMNEADFRIAEQWTDEGFITFARIGSKFLNGDKTHAVILSGEAWNLAHKERKTRFKRIYMKRDWLTIYELKKEKSIP